jgi:hypothetical protein
MTYPDLINRFILTGGGLLVFLSVVVILLTLIISIVAKWLIIPKIKKFLGLMDSLLTRMETNEKELTNVKHDVEITKQDFKNTRDLVANIAEISADHISEMKLMVNDLQETVKEVRDTVLIMAHEHNQNHNEKNNLSSFTFDKPNKHRTTKPGSVE